MTEPTYKWNPRLPRYGWELAGDFIIVQDYETVIMKISIHEVMDGTSVATLSAALSTIKAAPWAVK